MKTKFFLTRVTRFPKFLKLRKSMLALIVLGILLSACGAAEFATAPTVAASPPTQAATPAKAAPASTVAQPTAASPLGQPQNQNAVDVCGTFALNSELSVKATNAKYAILQRVKARTLLYRRLILTTRAAGCCSIIHRASPAMARACC
ncbi:MAG: hypothetical protein HZC38_10895 [Chloroflexi bacterium]|nr:hypothetical protein [Chloroflexota bacterium]